MKRFIEREDRSQVTLLPECLDDYIAEDNPMRVVDASSMSWTCWILTLKTSNLQPQVDRRTTRLSC